MKTPDFISAEAKNEAINSILNYNSFSKNPYPGEQVIYVAHNNNRKSFAYWLGYCEEEAKFNYTEAEGKIAASVHAVSEDGKRVKKLV